MDYKINIITCDLKHLPQAIIYPYSGNYQSSLILNKQINWDLKVLQIIWKYIVQAKILNQAKVLKINHKSFEVIEKLSQYANEVELNDKTNREGLAAKIYFSELFGKDFIRHNEDTINMALNYGYSILRSMISRSLVAKGLNPHIGIFHKGPNNSFNLSDDIIEVFRPLIDNYVHNNISNDLVFNREIRIKIVQALTRKINYDNQKITISNAINNVIDNIISVIDLGDLNKLKFPDVVIYDDI